MTIGILLISTGNYWIFLQPLITSIDNFFITDSKINIYLFSDRNNNIATSERITITEIPTLHKPFPYPTLNRYYFFTENADIIECDFVFYIDVDMMIVDKIDKEILPSITEDSGLVATSHPGFHNGGGAWCDNNNSLAYVSEVHRTKYFAGGFQGGKTISYLNAAKKMAHDISVDESKNIMAEWHDESHWNKYLINKNFKILSPAYCMPEQKELHEKWNISEFIPKIIALKKSHNDIREIQSVPYTPLEIPIKKIVFTPTAAPKSMVKENHERKIIVNLFPDFQKKNYLNYAQLNSNDKIVYDIIYSMLKYSDCVEKEIIWEMKNFNLPFILLKENNNYIVELEYFNVSL